ncbi:MAG: hypothetical protein K2X91_13775 [Thermoleophilia bacterium]|nr:hypothetical protein [Thermoleophilia bacterium]
MIVHQDEVTRGHLVARSFWGHVVVDAADEEGRDRNYIAALFDGRIAETIATGRDGPEGAEAGLRAKAEARLRADWPAVEAVAAAMLADRTLDGDEWSIVIDAFDEEKHWRQILGTFCRGRPLVPPRSIGHA